MELVANVFIYGAIILLIVMFIIFIIMYLRPEFKVKPKLLLKETVELDPSFVKSYTSNEIVLPDLEKGDELGITFGFRVFLENAMENEKWGRRFDQLKSIINFSPSVRYHPYDNYLEFGVEIRDNIQMSSFQTVRYDDPPLQKWLNIIVVYNANRIIVYLDKEMILNKKLKNPPIIKPKPLSVGEQNNNIKGFLGPVYYWNYPLKYDEILLASKLIK
jgi:hypothetical protein